MDLTGWLAWLQVSDEQLKELAVRTETTNPWYWGIRTLAKVGIPSGATRGKQKCGGVCLVG